MPRSPHGVAQGGGKKTAGLKIKKGRLTMVPINQHSISSKLASGTLSDADRLETVKTVEETTGQIARNIEDIAMAIEIYFGGSRAGETMEAALPPIIKRKRRDQAPAVSYTPPPVVVIPIKYVEREDLRTSRRDSGGFIPPP